jgi:hypothetical protein
VLADIHGLAARATQGIGFNAWFELITQYDTILFAYGTETTNSIETVHYRTDFGHTMLLFDRHVDIAAVGGHSFGITPFTVDYKLMDQKEATFFITIYGAEESDNKSFSPLQIMKLLLHMESLDGTKNEGKINNATVEAITGVKIDKGAWAGVTVELGYKAASQGTSLAELDAQFRANARAEGMATIAFLGLSAAHAMSAEWRMPYKETYSTENLDPKNSRLDRMEYEAIYGKGKGSQGVWKGNTVLLTGAEWYEYFKGKYGAENVYWKPNANVSAATQKTAEWLGANTRVITNDKGDKIFLSEDGLRRVRFDINYPDPHSSPHGHVEELVNGSWQKSGPLYPTDVPHK